MLPLASTFYVDNAETEEENNLGDPRRDVLFSLSVWICPQNKGIVLLFVISRRCSCRCQSVLCCVREENYNSGVVFYIPEANVEKST